MPVVGFNFSKVNVERNSQAAAAGKVDVSNNISLTDVSEATVNIGSSKEKGVKVSFEFTTKYEPNIGNMLFSGDILYLADAKKQQEVLSGWKKDKKLPKDVMAEILNSVLIKCNVEALILSRDVNLPTPIPLPRIQPQQLK